MEVHHHPHVEKKSFKEYLPEDFMIFLAEQIRENMVETNQEKGYINSMIKDLKTHMANVSYFLSGSATYMAEPVSCNAVTKEYHLN